MAFLTLCMILVTSLTMQRDGLVPRHVGSDEGHPERRIQHFPPGHGVIHRMVDHRLFRILTLLSLLFRAHRTALVPAILFLAVASDDAPEQHDDGAKCTTHEECYHNSVDADSKNHPDSEGRYMCIISSRDADDKNQNTMDNIPSILFAHLKLKHLFDHIMNHNVS